jgi:hypothetical protein
MITLDSNKVYIIITYGQSNGLGLGNVSDASDPILNPGASAKNYKVEWDWTNSVYTLSPNQQIVKSINDNNWNRISPSYYTVEGLDKRLTANSKPNPVFVNIAAAIGGIHLDGLKKGTGYYTKLVNAVQFVKNQFADKTVEVLFTSFIHGESDSYYHSRADVYAAGVIQLKNDLNTDLNAITGQSRRFGLYINQISWSIPGQAEGLPPQQKIKEIQRSFTDSEIVFALPTYQLDTATEDPSKPASDIHFGGYALLEIGETIADIFYKKEIAGETNLPILNKFFIQRLGANQVVVKLFNQPVNLMVDKTIPTRNDQRGFEFYDLSSNEQKIVGVEANGNDIILTFENPYTGGTLYYCYTYPYWAANATQMRHRGSIRTITGTPSLFYTKTHYSFLPAFKQSISK